jgi:hypothetical protein
MLHEQVSPLRWLGIALISAGVGFVAGSPALTAHAHHEPAQDPELEPATVAEISEADSYQGVASSIKERSQLERRP